MALILKEIKDAKPREKLYKLTDGMGLYLAVLPSGKKVWRFDYVNPDKKRKTKTIGDNDVVHRDEPRRLVLDYRERLSDDLDIEEKEVNSSRFKSIFKDWKSRLNQIFDFAVARGICEYNPVKMVSNNAFQKRKPKQQRHLKPNEIYQLNRFF